jgi:hypothetical protein
MLSAAKGRVIPSGQSKMSEMREFLSDLMAVAFKGLLRSSLVV